MNAQAHSGSPPHSQDAPVLPPVPRPITPAINRRAWLDPRARAWLLVSLVIVLAAAGLTAARTQEWMHKRWLIGHGTPVQAEIFGVSSLGEGKGSISTRNPTHLQFKYQGQTYMVWGLPDIPQESFDMHSFITIKIDPVLLLQRAAEGEPVITDPDVWTASDVLEPWYRETFVGLMLCIIAVPTLLAAIFIRRKILHVWRTGKVEEAVVVDAKPTALAPASRLVRCVLREQQDNRVIQVIAPRGKSIPQEGDALWLLVPPEGAAGAQAVASYPA